MNVLGHCEPVEFEVCERSGQLPWECGVAACENGCATKTVEFVPAAIYRGAVGALERIRDHANSADDAPMIAQQALNEIRGQ